MCQNSRFQGILISRIKTSYQKYSGIINTIKRIIGQISRNLKTRQAAYSGFCDRFGKRIYLDRYIKKNCPSQCMYLDRYTKKKLSVTMYVFSSVQKKNNSF